LILLVIAEATSQAGIFLHFVAFYQYAEVLLMPMA
jgi:hypothetical protein